MDHGIALLRRANRERACTRRRADREPTRGVNVIHPTQEILLDARRIDSLKIGQIRTMGGIDHWMVISIAGDQTVSVARVPQLADTCDLPERRCRQGGSTCRLERDPILAYATAVWLVTVLLAYTLERVGHRKPAEVLLRRLAYRRSVFSNSGRSGGGVERVRGEDGTA